MPEDVTLDDMVNFFLDEGVEVKTLGFDEEGESFECPDCDGFGYTGDDGEEECSRCSGDGVIHEKPI